MKKRSIPFKAYESPSYVEIIIEDQKVIVKIFLDTIEGVSCRLELTYNGVLYTKNFDKIKTTHLIYDSSDVDFAEIKLDQIEKEKIAKCMNEKLNYLFD